MQKPLIAVLLASAASSLNAQAADLIQVYQQALANDATYASARASLAAGRESITAGPRRPAADRRHHRQLYPQQQRVSPFNEGATLINPITGAPAVIGSAGATANTKQVTVSAAAAAVPLGPLGNLPAEQAAAGDHAKPSSPRPSRT